MKKKRQSFIIILLFLILFTVSNLWINNQQILAEDTGSGKQAPDFTLLNLDGESVQLSSFKGKVVILDFWATWCPPCREEIPHFKELYQQYQSQGLEVVGIALDRGGVNVVKPFAEDFKINYPILIGNQDVAADYGGIRGIPTTFVIDRKGRIIEKFVGYRDKEIFESAIQKLL